MSKSSVDFRIIPGSKVLEMADGVKGWIFGSSIGGSRGVSGMY